MGTSWEAKLDQTGLFAHDKPNETGKEIHALPLSKDAQTTSGIEFS